MSILNQLSIKSLYMLSVIAESTNLQQAAIKLCISQSALTHQMQRLEERIGRDLFYKQGRNQKLYPEAKEWAKKLYESFSDIQNTSNQFLNPHNSIINLGVPSAFAFNIVTPSLGLWLQERPDLDVRIKMLNCEDVPENLNLDVVLSTPCLSKQFETENITPEKYIPVCSKSLYEKFTANPKDDFFNEIPLLELNEIDSWGAWSDYFSKPINSISMKYFSHSILMLQAVLSSQGVAILDYYLVKPQIEKGLIVQMCEEPMLLDNHIHSVSIRKNRKRESQILDLKKWLMTLFKAQSN